MIYIIYVYSLKRACILWKMLGNLFEIKHAIDSIYRILNFINKILNFINRILYFIWRILNFIDRILDFINIIQNFINRILDFIKKILNFIKRILDFISRILNSIKRVLNLVKRAKNMYILSQQNPVHLLKRMKSPKQPQPPPHSNACTTLKCMHTFYILFPPPKKILFVQYTPASSTLYEIWGG